MSDILLTNLAILVSHGDNLTRGQRNLVQQAYAEINRLRVENTKLDATVIEQRDKIEDMRAELEAYEAKDRGFFPADDNQSLRDEIEDLKGQVSVLDGAYWDLKAEVDPTF